MKCCVQRCVCEVQGEGNVVYSDVCVVQDEGNVVYRDVCLRYMMREMFTVMCV